ncbi:MAG: hypothetical protein ACHQFX_18480, partial [Chitinophagales bacterium]
RDFSKTKNPLSAEQAGKLERSSWEIFVNQVSLVMVRMIIEPIKIIVPFGTHHVLRRQVPLLKRGI